MKVILTGMRGTGKSSIGRCLAGLLDYTFIDTDAAIEELAGCRIAEIVARHGWDHFRTLERQVVAGLATAEQVVIAAGGGTLMDVENAACLKENGLTVLLIGDLSVLQRRIAQGSTRPSLTGQAAAETELEEVWAARRERYYAVADLTYDVSEESTDLDHDVWQKALAIQGLLLQTPSFRGPLRDAGEAL